MRYIFFSILAVGCSLFFISPTKAAISTVDDIRIDTVTQDTVTISFPRPADQQDEENFYYVYRVQKNDKSDIGFAEATNNGRFTFTFKPLAPGTTQTFYITVEKNKKNWVTPGYSYVPKTVETSDFSKPIVITTKQAVHPSVFPTPKLTAFTKIIGQKYPWARITVSYEVFDPQGTRTDGLKTTTMDYIYGEKAFVTYDFVRHGIPAANAKNSLGALYVGVDDEGYLQWWGNNSGQGGVVRLDQEILPKNFASLPYNRFGVKIEKNGRYVIYDEDDAKYILATVTDLRIKEGASPSVRSQLKEKKKQSAPIATWEQPTYETTDVASFTILHRCITCSDPKLRKSIQTSVPATTKTNYWYVLPYEKEKIAGKKIRYTVRTHFISGAIGQWSAPAYLHME